MKTTNVIKDRIVETVHKLKSTFTVSLFVPPHPPRTESKGWEELARKLKKEDVACRVCGVRDSTMSDPNKILMELHKLNCTIKLWSGLGKLLQIRTR